MTDQQQNWYNFMVVVGGEKGLEYLSNFFPYLLSQIAKDFNVKLYPLAVGEESEE